MLILSIGSNLGNREANLNNAIQALEEKFGKPVAISSIYVTEPWGVINQQDYFNQIVAYHTPDVLPEQILDITQQIECDLGRERTTKWAARTIDIDILMLSECVWQSERLIIPHPLLCNRLFVLKPLAEILPHFLHPVHKKKVVDLLAECRDKSNIQTLTQFTKSINTP
jgi:2-amino-4-hydroxy-6-hydroxymethyldihydropteridine diphosphokinase